VWSIPHAAGALKRALAAVRDGRLALLNVLCERAP
jgi:hypothetical protein